MLQWKQKVRKHWYKHNIHFESNKNTIRNFVASCCLSISFVCLLLLQFSFYWNWKYTAHSKIESKEKCEMEADNWTVDCTFFWCIKENWKLKPIFWGWYKYLMLSFGRLFLRCLNRSILYCIKWSHTLYNAHILCVQ